MFMKLVNEFDYEISARHNYAYSTTFNVDTFVNLQESFSPLNANMEYTATFECIPTAGTQLTKTHVFRTAGEHPEFTDISLMFLNDNLSNVTSFDTTDIGNISIGWNSIIGTQTATNDPIPSSVVLPLSTFNREGSAIIIDDYIRLNMDRQEEVGSIYKEVGAISGDITIEFDFWGTDKSNPGDGLVVAYTNVVPNSAQFQNRMFFAPNPVVQNLTTSTHGFVATVRKLGPDPLDFFYKDNSGITREISNSSIDNTVYTGEWHTFKYTISQTRYVNMYFNDTLTELNNVQTINFTPDSSYRIYI
eukprot:gene32796-41775_t